MGTPGPRGLTPKQRVKRLVSLSDSGCWIWTAALDWRGYGQIKVTDPSGRRRTVSAHRFSYAAYLGECPEGLVLDHLCRTPACVNPAHLEPVTQAENMRRARRTECRKGHPYTPENTYLFNGARGETRTCRTCQRNNVRRYAQRKKDKNK